MKTSVLNKKKRTEWYSSTKEYPLFFTDPKFIEALEQWIDIREHKKKPVTQQGLRRQLNELTKLSEGNLEIAIKIIEKSVDNGWIGLFPLKNNTNEYSKTSRSYSERFNKDTAYNNSYNELKSAIAGYDFVAQIKRT